MMKSTILTLAGLFCCALSFAQDPVKWTFASKKVADGAYEVLLSAQVAKPWHIYSQSSPADAARPTTITFKKNPLLTLQGVPKENGKMISKFEENFGKTVKFYEDKVSFVQVVKMRGSAKTTIAGNIEYMVCNDHECRLGDPVDFTVALQ
ncbi:protein-disulfide reductase DsbD domain-containing protein [Chitinophaga pollutisoli]|uniref:Protein-disulfide reductase DsbD domain-containing protein n=1 Tax=Chitinophaga pollutisoli TaxID=3133966 RepID=A0ABZ2YRB6_9BACT